MSKRRRRHFTGEQKATAVKRHHLEKVPVSEICNELDIHPNQFYDWQRQFFENGASSFSKDNVRESKKSSEKITTLEERIAHKDNVISEIMSEYIDLKKKLGGS